MLKLDTRKLVLASILAGLSGVFEIIPGPPFDIPFPLYTRVSWDLTGMPMMISLLFTGPIGAVYTCLIGCSVIFLRGNVYGGTFKIIAELATILAFAAIRKGFIPKTVAAVASRILVMTVANYCLLPVFYGMPTSFVVSILPALAVMNGTQALINIIPAQIVNLRLGGTWLLIKQTIQPTSGPSKIWYLVPLFFGVLGGIVGYVAIKNEDKQMAERLLWFGIGLTIFYVIIIWLLYSLVISLLFSFW